MADMVKRNTAGIEGGKRRDCDNDKDDASDRTMWFRRSRPEIDKLRRKICSRLSTKCSNTCTHSTHHSALTLTKCGKASCGRKPDGELSGDVERVLCCHRSVSAANGV
jgi:hypothetical protein